MESIRTLRRVNNLTQKQLGEMCGLKQQYVNQIETGKVVPTIKTYEKIVNAMGYTVEVKR